MYPPARRPQPSIGFTLIEMLVSVTVLVLIMTFIAQMMNSATISTTLSGRHVDTDAEARMVFDRMAIDFARMSRRTDVDFIFSKLPTPPAPNEGSGTDTSGTDNKMFFYAEAPAYPASVTTGSDDSTQALIGYTINVTGSASMGIPPYSLERLSMGLSYDANGTSANDVNSNVTPAMMFLTSTSIGALPIPASTLSYAESGVVGTPDNNYSPDASTALSYYDSLSQEVLRMDYCFQVKDLTYPSAPTTAYSNFPIAYFNPKLKPNNQDFYSTPGTNNGPSGGSVTSIKTGDRWYDTQNNRAYVCTAGYVPAIGNISAVPPVWTPDGLADVKAIVVAIAILDKNSRKLIPNTTQLAGLASILPDPSDSQLNPQSENASSTAQPQLMADLWQSAISGYINPASSSSASTSSQATIGVPGPVAAQLRVYQRYFYLNNN